MTSIVHSVSLIPSHFIEPFLFLPLLKLTIVWELYVGLYHQGVGILFNNGTLEEGCNKTNLWVSPSSRSDLGNQQKVLIPGFLFF